MKSTHLLIIFLIVLAEGQTGGGSFLDRFSHRRISHRRISPGGIERNLRGGCFAELKAQGTTLFKIPKARGEPDDFKMSKITLDPSVRTVARSNRKTLNVQGNCCWKFYKG